MRSFCLILRDSYPHLLDEFNKFVQMDFSRRDFKFEAFVFDEFVQLVYVPETLRDVELYPEVIVAVSNEISFEISAGCLAGTGFHLVFRNTYI